MSAVEPLDVEPSDQVHDGGPPGYEPILEVEDLRVEFRTRRGIVRAVDGVGFTLTKGETLGIIGESGSGKSVTALALVGLIQPPGGIVGGTITFKGRDLVSLPPQAMRRVRGSEIAMVFQDPMTSMNPVFRTGWQVGEALRLHQGMRRGAASVAAIGLLRAVGIPDAPRRATQYPHEFSGGMRQRAMIAMATADRPDVIVADEPTTALDVTTQAQILDLLRENSAAHGTSTVLITHNFGVVAGTCDRVMVMYAGRVVEDGPTADVFAHPQHPYTWSLLRSVPRLDAVSHGRLLAIDGSPPDLADTPAGCAFHPRCRFKIAKCAIEEPPLATIEPGHRARCWVTQQGVELGSLERPPSHRPPAPGVDPAEPVAVPPPVLEVRGLTTRYAVTKGLRGTKAFVRAVDDVDLVIGRGETLALVGESGCGKTTLGRSILRLVEPAAGTVIVNGQELATLSRAELRRQRRHAAMVFQDPSSSLDPRQTVGEIIGEALDIHRLSPGKPARSARIRELLGLVGLNQSAINRYPHEFSGGERQRVGIARALAVEPAFIVCDEPVSALDVSIQAQIINLLDDLQERLGLTYLFITHDLSVARHIADRVAVMYLGKIVEVAPVDEFFAHPRHPYTASLISAIPIPDPAVEARRRRIPLSGEVPSPLNPPSGCRFHTRCFKAQASCTEREPTLEPTGPGGHEVACFFPIETGIAGLHEGSPRHGS